MKQRKQEKRAAQEASMTDEQRGALKDEQRERGGKAGSRADEAALGQGDGEQIESGD